MLVFLLTYLIVCSWLLSCTKGNLDWKILSPGGVSSSLKLVDIGLSGQHYVAAIGDFDSDRSDDYIVVDQNRRVLTVYLWRSNLLQFRASEARIVLTEGSIVNVIPCDFDHNGKLDCLVTYVKDNDNIYYHRIYYGENTRFTGLVTDLPQSKEQITLVDYFGTMKVDILGNFKQGDEYQLSIFTSSQNLIPFQQNGSKFPCRQFSKDYSSGLIDFDGDCMPDLYFTCSDYAGMNSKSLNMDIYLNGPQEYRLDKRIQLDDDLICPIASKDINGDGSMDLIYATSKAFHILYNTQRPFCVDSNGSSPACKDHHNLCEHDDSYGYNVTSEVDHMVIPFTKLFDDKLTLALRDPFNQPIPLKFGDFDLNGYPCMLVITSNSKVAILNNVRCNENNCTPEQVRKGYHTFELNKDIQKDLVEYNNVWSATFVDFAHDGIIDIQINAYDSDGNFITWSLLNDYYQDAFFLNLGTLNGVCPVNCAKGERYPNPKPYGVSYPGAVYKYSVIDMTGVRRIKAAAQYTHTNYLALMSPSVFFGLGRMNTFVEVLFVGVSSRMFKHYNRWMNIIPNSNLIIFPPYDDESSWAIELHINPGKYILWVSIALICTMVLLAVIVLIFRRMEKEEDKREKEKSSHKINFNAL